MGSSQWFCAIVSQVSELTTDCTDVPEAAAAPGQEHGCERGLVSIPRASSAHRFRPPLAGASRCHMLFASRFAVGFSRCACALAVPSPAFRFSQLELLSVSHVGLGFRRVLTSLPSALPWPQTGPQRGDPQIINITDTSGRSRRLLREPEKKGEHPSAPAHRRSGGGAACRSSTS